MALTIGPRELDPLHTQRSTAKVDANDFKRFTALRADARADDPAALREVARQFESIFTKMMLESMRAASFGDPLFGGDQADMYQGMMDDQLAVEMSQGKGLGLADMLIRQLSHGQNLKAPGEVADTGKDGFPLDDAAKRQFIEQLLPHAEAAARELGVDPRAIVAQAALETGWGRSRPADSVQGSSNNYFGIKAGGAWDGASVASATTEFEAGTPGREIANFRAYASAHDSVQDYVSLLRDNPRYSAALNTGQDVRAFATALQRGGYATDPDYANKLVGVFQQLQQLGGRQEVAASLKAGHAGPLTGVES